MYLKEWGGEGTVWRDKCNKNMKSATITKKEGKHKQFKRHNDLKQLGDNRVCLAYIACLQSIMKGNQGSNVRQELKHRA